MNCVDVCYKMLSGDREGLPEAADGVPVEEGRRQEGRPKMGAEPRPRVQDPQRGKVTEMVRITR